MATTDFCPNQSLLWCLQNVYFPKLLLPSYLSVAFYCKEELSLLLYLFISLFIHLSSRWALGFLFYSMSYNPLISLFVLILCPRFGDCPTWRASGSSFRLTPVSFRYTSIWGGRIFLLSDTIWYFGLAMYLLCPSPGINHFSKKLWFLLMRNGI